MDGIVQKGIPKMDFKSEFSQPEGDPGVSLLKAYNKRFKEILKAYKLDWTNFAPKICQPSTEIG